MALNDKSVLKYYLYIDECGDHQLEKFNPNFPIFTLCGVLIPEQSLGDIENAVKAFKNEFFGIESIILHSRDIRKQERVFYSSEF